MKKVLSIMFLFILVFVTGCSNNKNLNCTMNLKVGEFSENWSYSFIFDNNTLQSYTLSDSSKYKSIGNKINIPKKVSNPKELKIGDVVAFKNSEYILTIHRIIDIVENNGITYFATKGDNYNTQDNDLLPLDAVLFQNVETIDEIKNQSYSYVKNYFKELGYTCK